MNDQLLRCHVFTEVESLVGFVTNAIEESATDAIEQSGSFKIVLAGGSTPEAVYERLPAIEANWSAWHIYFGDERCLPEGHRDRNDVMARRSWLGHVPIPPSQIHAISAHLGAEIAAERYAAELAGIGRFDLVLLGLGEDGHTASLFPGHPAGSDSRAPDVLAVHKSPKPPPDRVSMSASRLSRSRAVYFLVIGAGKAAAVKQLCAGAQIPAARILPAKGVDLFVDQSALGNRHLGSEQ